MTNNKRKKLKDLLISISSEGEKREIQALDSLKVKEIVSTFDEAESEYTEKYQKMEATLDNVLKSFDSYRKTTNKYSDRMAELFGNMTENFTKNFEKLGGTISTSYEKNKPVNAAGVYKDMLNQLSEVNQSIKDKPVPVWNWPQYASVSVRNKNFANINPAVDGFNIGSFDDVVLTYTGSNLHTVTYKANGVNVAVLTLSYDGSNNLTEIVRTS